MSAFSNVAPSTVGANAQAARVAPVSQTSVMICPDVRDRQSEETVVLALANKIMERFHRRHEDTCAFVDEEAFVSDLWTACAQLPWCSQRAISRLVQKGKLKRTSGCLQLLVSLDAHVRHVRPRFTPEVDSTLESMLQGARDGLFTFKGSVVGLGNCGEFLAGRGCSLIYDVWLKLMVELRSEDKLEHHVVEVHVLPEAVAEAAGWSMQQVYFLRCAARTPRTLHVVHVQRPLSPLCRSGHEHRPKEGRLRDREDEKKLSEQILCGVVRNLGASSGEYVVVKHGRPPRDVSPPLCARCGYHSSAELAKNVKTKVHLVRIPPFSGMPPNSDDYYNQTHHPRARYARHTSSPEATPRLPVHHKLTSLNASFVQMCIAPLLMRCRDADEPPSR